MARKVTKEMAEDGSVFASVETGEKVTFEDRPTPVEGDWKTCAICHLRFQGDQATHDAFQHR